jgi:hypothetical protein
MRGRLTATRRERRLRTRATTSAERVDRGQLDAFDQARLRPRGCGTTTRR